MVAGFASLNNFPLNAMIERLGAYSRSQAAGVVRPLITVPTNSGNYYVLGPYDFATIYNVLALWQGNPAINGSGQTIAIVGSSNINIQDVRDFRSLFGLSANDPQIIVNGADPGVTGGIDESEADLDTEWSGALAPNATIELVVSESTESTFGADLSAVYIVDNNLAPILSASYGSCEAALGDGGNAFYNALWGQGAAQGITILVATGDNGSAGCDESGYEAAAQYGLMVSGTASTPFNVAVGGTDFNDVNTWSNYWSTSNNLRTLASALSYIPETTWNDSCAHTAPAGSCANAGSDTPSGIDLVGGSGGASNCVTLTSTDTSFTCTGGYPKPAWQGGNGVPNDGARDLPDVSLFASNGENNSFYLVCQADALPSGDLSCTPGYGAWYFMGAGGTSASTPAFAGIMGLVDQKTGERQGNANYVLYSLAAKTGASCSSTASMAATANTSSCIFYDVVTGNNSVACQGGTPNCSSTTNGSYGVLEVSPPSYTTPAWTTAAGYDLATGLGSVNAANLVKNWSSVSFNPSTTSLASLSPTTLTHGQPATFTVNVSPGSGSGTPTGAVSLMTQTGTSSSNVTGIGPFTLSGGTVTNSTNMLPGGTYGVTAHYAGNGTYGASDSTPPAQVTVSPEGSQTHAALLTFNPLTGLETSSNASSAAYGSPYILRVDVTNSSGENCYSVPYGCATGQVTLTDNGQPLDLGTYKLNSEGYAEDQPIQLATGSHRLSASYSGDSSYNSSTSPTDAISITPAPTTTTYTGLPSSSIAGNVTVSVTINTQSYGTGPSGTVQLMVNGAPVGVASKIAGEPFSPTAGAFATGTASITASLPAGNDNVTVQYSGDNNYAGSTSAPGTISVTDFSMAGNPSTINISAPGQSGTTTLSLTPLNGFTGWVNLSCGIVGAAPGLSCAVSTSGVELTGSSPMTATLTVSTVAPAGAALTSRPRRILPQLRMTTSRRWMLAVLLALAIMMILSAPRRRRAALLIATALLVGIWVACGGGGGGGGGSTPPATPAVGLSSPSLTFGQQLNE